MTAKTNGMSPEDAINPDKALVPAVQKVNELRVRKGFWPKMRRTAARIPFAGQALAAWYATQDPKTPLAAKGLILGALAYFVMPVDAIPDVLAVVGFSDDAAVIAAVLATFGANIKDKHHQKAKETLTRMREEETGD